MLVYASHICVYMIHLMLEFTEVVLCMHDRLHSLLASRICHSSAFVGTLDEHIPLSIDLFII